MDMIMTLGELAEFLKAQPATIYRLLREKRIPAFRVESEMALSSRLSRAMDE